MEKWFRCTILVFLCGCSTPPPAIKYYVLDAQPQKIDKKLSKKRVKISDIKVPEYLNQPKLILKRENQRLEITNYHSWAESLQESIKRVLISDLNASAETYSYVEDCRNCKDVDIKITHFYPTIDGEVFLAGQIYHQSDVDYFYFSKRISEDGFEESVKTMRSLVKSLAEKVSEIVHR